MAHLQSTDEDEEKVQAGGETQREVEGAWQGLYTTTRRNPERSTAPN